MTITASVAVSTLAEVIQRALFKYPDHKARIEKAALLLIYGHVERNQEGGFAVRSQTQPGHRYAVSRDTCACEYRRRHQSQACKHQIAIRMLLIAEERERVLADRRRQRFSALTGAELARLSEFKAAYEQQQAGV